MESGNKEMNDLSLQLAKLVQEKVDEAMRGKNKDQETLGHILSLIRSEFSHAVQDHESIRGTEFTHQSAINEGYRMGLCNLVIKIKDWYGIDLSGGLDLYVTQKRLDDDN